MKRNPSIELYRCMLMFGIVLLHCAGNGAARAPWLGNLLKFCVTGFVFISGYFGIKFTWRKLLYLYGVAIYCAFLGAITQYCVTGNIHILGNSFLYMKRFWFLHAYAVLMLFAPILNHAFELRGRELLLVIFPVLVLVFGWSYCYEIGHLKPYVFETAGLGAHTPLTLIGIYVLAKWFRILEIEECIKDWHAFICTIILIPVAAVGLAPYNSIFAFALAVSVFLIIKRKTVHCGQWPTLLAPSMFSVYLLHVTDPGLSIIRHYVVLGHWGGKYITMLSTASVLFLICLFLDLCRRAVLSGLKVKKS